MKKFQPARYNMQAAALRIADGNGPQKPKAGIAALPKR
jgi:hypothetical protein